MKLEEGLIEKCIEGDRKAQHELYKLLYDMLIRTSMKYAVDRDQTLDFVNKSFLKIYLNLKKHKEAIPFELWARKIAINVIIDEKRKTKRYGAIFSLKPDKFWNHSNAVAIENENENLNSEWLEVNLKRLPEKTQEVFKLYAIKGQSHKEISKSMAISEGTSHWHVNQAKKKLKKLFNQKEYN